MVRPGPRIREATWVESHEQKDAARALEMLHVQLISAVIDPYSWKWVIVSAHHAVQAFVVASLSGGGETTSGVPEGSKRWLTLHYRPPNRYAEQRQDYLPELYECVKRATGFRVPGPVDEAVARLVECRNAFIQCIPARWSLNVSELPRTVRDCLKVVEYLGWNPGHITWQSESLTDLARVKYLASMKILDALEDQYKA